MRNDYLIVHKKILPVYFEDVIRTRHLVEEEKKSVSDACRATGISRSTYYKYKDYVYYPASIFGKRAIISFYLEDKRGILSDLLQYIASIKANVVTIHQEAPIQNKAYVAIAIDMSRMELAIEEVLYNIKNLEGVIQATLVAIE